MKRGENMLWEYISFAIGREMEFVLRLVISCICGGVIGFERSRRRKEAGIRTHILVALGASMMMIVSKYAKILLLNLHQNLNLKKLNCLLQVK